MAFRRSPVRSRSGPPNPEPTGNTWVTNDLRSALRLPSRESSTDTPSSRKHARGFRQFVLRGFEKVQVGVGLVP